jgi:hypothetical protein
MLQARALPPKLWDDAINYASYIQNRVPHKSIKGFTPYEAWSRKKPEVTSEFSVPVHGLGSLPIGGKLRKLKIRSVLLLDIQRE